MIGALLAFIGPVLIIAAFAGKLLSGMPGISSLPVISDFLAWVGAQFPWLIGGGVFFTVLLLYNKGNILTALLAACVAVLLSGMLVGFVG